MMQIAATELELDVVLPPVSGVRADDAELAIGTQRFAPGQTMRAHYHRTYREVVIVMSGEIVLVVDGRELSMRAGDKCVVERESVHEVRNVSDADAELTYLKVPFGDPSDTVELDA
jgi:quercetin dioxygenase-like cupin family protein